MGKKHWWDFEWDMERTGKYFHQEQVGRHSTFSNDSAEGDGNSFRNVEGTGVRFTNDGKPVGPHRKSVDVVDCGDKTRVRTIITRYDDEDDDA